MMDCGRIIDGTAISLAIKEEIRNETRLLVESGSPPPGIAVLLIGNRNDSATYVRMKERACQDIGFNSTILKFPSETTTQDQIISKINELNDDPLIHGILVQLPLPNHMNEKEVLQTIAVSKDVDGFHPLQIGKLCLKDHEPDFVPCTPKGCMELLNRSGVDVSGKLAVVIGRSNIVGIPMSLLLMNADATVTTCHSKTPNIPQICRQADILVSAIGKASFVKRDWIKPGAVIIDVGINSIPDPTKKSGYRLVGDVDPGAYEMASRYTPVPGGVGPMTVAMLMKNTLLAAKRRYESKK